MRRHPADVAVDVVLAEGFAVATCRSGRESNTVRHGQAGRIRIREAEVVGFARHRRLESHTRSGVLVGSSRPATRKVLVVVDGEQSLCV